jgi:hypothetical protein
MAPGCCLGSGNFLKGSCSGGAQTWAGGRRLGLRCGRKGGAAAPAQGGVQHGPVLAGVASDAKGRSGRIGSSRPARGWARVDGRAWMGARRCARFATCRRHAGGAGVSGGYRRAPRGLLGWQALPPRPTPCCQALMQTPTSGRDDKDEGGRRAARTAGKKALVVCAPGAADCCGPRIPRRRARAADRGWQPRCSASWRRHKAKSQAARRPALVPDAHGRQSAGRRAHGCSGGAGMRRMADRASRSGGWVPRCGRTEANRASQARQSPPAIQACDGEKIGGSGRAGRWQRRSIAGGRAGARREGVSRGRHGPRGVIGARGGGPRSGLRRPQQQLALAASRDGSRGGARGGRGQAGESRKGRQTE